MSSLDKLCFILVERQKANTLRRKYLARFHSSEEKLYKRLKYQTCHRLKKPSTAKLLKEQKDNHESYRRVADLMNDQRPLLRQLRKDLNARMSYNTCNNCVMLHHDGINYTWQQVEQLHTSYVFETQVLKESSLHNPYAKELYGKETKQAEIDKAN